MRKNGWTCRSNATFLHTYNEETAQDIYRHIKEDYIGLLQVLDRKRKINRWI